jgi:hypothetical protein
MEVTNKLLRESEVGSDLRFTWQSDPLIIRCPADTLIREWKVLPCRSKAKQHPRDLAEVAGARNVYRDRITTAGRQGTFVRVANNEKTYIVDRGGIQEPEGMLELCSKSYM